MLRFLLRDPMIGAKPAIELPSNSILQLLQIIVYSIVKIDPYTLSNVINLRPMSMQASFCIATLKNARSVMNQIDYIIIGVGDEIKLGVLDALNTCLLSKI